MVLDCLLNMYNTPILESPHKYKKLKALWNLIWAKKFLVVTIDKTIQETDYNIVCKRTSSDNLNIIAEHLRNTTYYIEQEYTLLDYYRILHE